MEPCWGFYPEHAFKVGIDPASSTLEDLRKIADVAIHDFFDFTTCRKRLGNQKAKIITAIAMFYMIEDLHEFMAGIKSMLDEKGVFIAQFMGMPQMVRINDIGNICHEHLFYFTWESLKKLMDRHNLSISKVVENDINGGSWQLWITHGLRTCRLQGARIRY